ncbi:SRPBCC family protein [Streptomyces pseudogriseolus]|uniref:SRPBCC family protein n=1 Tax=Streptomyces pseudogriseolus TaxID=36817 RepID=UPI001CE3AFD6|nr:SRPBCC family protein [Streptomyces pseudogriseolus]
MAAEPTGTFLTLDDGRPAVRFVRDYDHPVDRVWRFVTDADELVHWFPSRAEIDLRPGGAVVFSGDPALEDSTGRVVAVDPPRHLSFTWEEDEIHFDLEELGEKHTRFTLTNVLGAENTAARNSAGWDVCLSALDAWARGERFEGPHAGPDAPARALYEAYVAAGVPSGAPYPGADD